MKNANKLMLSMVVFGFGGCASIMHGLSPAPRKLTSFPAPVASAAIDPALDGFSARFAEAHPDRPLLRVQSAQVEWTIDRNDVGIILHRSAKLNIAYKLADGRCWAEQHYLLEENLGEDKWAPPEVGAGPGDNASLDGAEIDCAVVAPTTTAVR